MSPLEITKTPHHNLLNPPTQIKTNSFPSLPLSLVRYSLLFNKKFFLSKQPPHHYAAPLILCLRILSIVDFAPPHQFSTDSVERRIAQVLLSHHHQYPVKNGDVDVTRFHQDRIFQISVCEWCRGFSVDNMSSSSRSDADDVEELFQIESRCREMRKEKDMLRQSQSLDLVRTLEVYVKSLIEARSEDKKHIQKLEQELMNCSQEIDYLVQEMAELRYQLTSLLEEECKRRSCIEQASLQRIGELEAQIQKEQTKPFAVVMHLNGA